VVERSVKGREVTPRTWFIDELSYAGRENLDPAHAERYDGKEDADAAGEVALLGHKGLTPESLVVEFGAGTGQFTAEVARACARVIAVDVSSVMLRRLQAKVTALEISNVDVVKAGFLTYEHSGPPADFVYSRFALHHLPDFWKAVALDRLRRVLRPGGILRLWDVVYDFAPAEVEDRIEAWCATGGDGVDGEWSRAELEEHVRDEHSTFTWVLEPMIERSGFEITHVEYSEDRVFARYVLRAL
jgi:ubiquinone/menaquinone biosynthesis C-methylase UbiE